MKIQGTASLDSLTALVAHMAETEKVFAGQSKGEELKEAFQNKQEAKTSMKAKKKEMEANKARADYWHGRSWWKKPFDGSKAARYEKKRAQCGAAVQRLQKDLAAESEKIAELQDNMKDALEDYGASRSVVDDIRKEIQDAREASVTV